MPAAVRSRLSRIAVAAPAAAALVLGTLAFASPAIADTTAGDPSAAKELTGSHPDWATPQADAGAVPAGTPATARVYLASRDPLGLAAYAQAVSDQNSPDYGKFLSTAEAKDRFGTSDEQVKAVTQWLTGAGLTISETNAHYLQVTGTTDELTRALGAQFRNYRTDDGTHKAPATDAVVPAAVAADVAGVEGLADTVQKASSNAVSVAAADADAQARAAGTNQPDADPAKTPKTLPTTATCTDGKYGSKTATGAPAGYEKNEPFAPCSYVPSQLRKAYGVTNAKVTGKGATVAIVDAYGLGTMEADANKFSAAHGDQPFAPGQYKEVLTPNQWTHQADCGDWSGEEALDVEMVHGMAPDANVVYVGANSCEDPDLNAALSNIVDNHLADVVSNSYGEIMHGKSGDLDPAVIAADNQVFQLGATEGITFMASAGDCGDNSPGAAATGVNCQADTNQAQTQWPSSSPWITAVGGTALELKDKSGTYGHEVNMGDERSVLSADGKSWTPAPGQAPFYFGGGGGVVKGEDQPWYQKGVVPDSISTVAADGTKSATPQRATPDVAMSGDLVAATLVGFTPAGGAYSEGGYGGTSVSSPEFAGIMADAIQARGGRPIGFANPDLYDRYNTRAFHDVNDSAVHTKRGNVVDLGMVGGALKVRLYKIGADYGLSATKGYDTATGLGSPAKGFFKSFTFKQNSQDDANSQGDDNSQD
ncbi:S53 family peptidase [Kitasatospora kifunensis]|uniref:Subtilase family serine protease n=1 Tax=Kitasatospora kifunensis TaxID=58351 RepID=A0A7W7VWB3_KITKI|nr:S53 family peptidase [Kitasatospora kifunensis]MBB4925317.1 subtilase family serine protease [Kitasatospora kifunensis]